MRNGVFTYQAPSAYSGGPHDLVAITKFTPDGSHLLYSTYLGGSQYVCANAGPVAPQGNLPWAMTVDGNGDVISGDSSANDDTQVGDNAPDKH